MPVQSGTILPAQSVVQMPVVLSTAGMRESVQPYMSRVVLEVRSLLLAENGSIPVVLSVLAPTFNSRWVTDMTPSVPFAGDLTSDVVPTVPRATVLGPMVMAIVPLAGAATDCAVGRLCRGLG